MCDNRSMARSSLFDALRTTFRTSTLDLPAREAVELVRSSRRSFVKGAAVLSAGVAARGFAAPRTNSNLRIGVVGAGLGGLACAYEL
jgi:hypothetical protein